jgi:hypothetical protein
MDEIDGKEGLLMIIKNYGSALLVTLFIGICIGTFSCRSSKSDSLKGEIGFFCNQLENDITLTLDGYEKGEVFIVGIGKINHESLICLFKRFLLCADTRKTDIKTKVTLKTEFQNQVQMIDDLSKRSETTKALEEMVRLIKKVNSLPLKK